MFCPQFLGDYCGIHKGSLKFGFHNSTGKWQRIGRQLTHVVCQRIMAAHGPSWADDSPWRISGLTEKNRICTASCPDVPRAINFHGPCIFAVLPPHASLVAIAPGMATILLKCWFWVHCSICGKLYGTRCPVRPLPPWNHPQTCLFNEFRPSERTICSAISAFRRSNSCEEHSSRLKPRLQLGTIVEDDAVSQWDISSAHSLK